MTTIHLPYIDRTSIVGSNVEIMGRRTLHGPETTVVIPKQIFFDEVGRPIGQQIAGELSAAQKQAKAWNGCFVFIGLDN